jgi:hypothetical protein
MGRIVSRNGSYYEEGAFVEPVENGAALFSAQLEQDLKSARADQQKLRKELPNELSRILS